MRQICTTSRASAPRALTARLGLVFLLISTQPGQSRQPPEATGAPPTPQEIRAAVRNLSSEDFSEREKASAFLWNLGETAAPALREAAKSPHVEVRTRSRNLLEHIRYGIYPDTPASARRWISRFRDGNDEMREEAVKMLCEDGRFRSALRLVRILAPGEKRDLLAAITVEAALGKARELVADGDWAAAGGLLEQAAMDNDGMCALAVFHAARGTLDARLHLQEAAGTTPRNTRLFAWLLRARGDLERAAKIARETGLEDLATDLAAANGAWGSFLEAKLRTLDEHRLDPANGREANGRAEPPPESVNWEVDLAELSLTSALHRIKGDRKAFEQTTRKLLDWSQAESRKEFLLPAIEALIINGNAQDALDVLEEAGPHIRFRLLAQQQRYRQAFRSLGIEDIKPPFTAWSDGINAKLSSEHDPVLSYQRVAQIAYVAEVCMKMGEKSEAARLIESTLRTLKEDVDARANFYRALVQMLDGMGEREKARAFAFEGLVSQGEGFVMECLAGKNAGLAYELYEFMHDRNPEIEDRKLLAEVCALANPRPDQRGVYSRELAAFVDSLKKESPALRRLAVRVCNVHGLTAQALEIQKQIASDRPDMESWWQLAEMYMNTGKWSDAAKAYAECVRTSADHGAAALYQWALARERAGETGKEVNDVFQRAVSLPLGDTRQHVQLSGLMWSAKDWGRFEESARQIRSLASTVEDYPRQTLLRLADRTRVSDPGRAADCLELALLTYLYPRSHQSLEPRILLHLAAQRHRYRSHALFTAGETDKALRHVRVFHNLNPGDASVSEDILPYMERAGLRAEADAIFERAFTLNTDACDLFPRSPSAHNNLAWLCARARRRLDVALEHAEKAVALEPESGAYLDTLAEVHFALGDRTMAVSFSRKAVKLEPADPLLKLQLEKFEAEER